MSFVQRVINDLLAGRMHTATTIKPTGYDMLFSKGYNELSGTPDAWSVSYRAGLFFTRPVLNRGEIDDLPLTRSERKDLLRAFFAANERIVKRYKVTLRKMSR